MPPCRSCGKVQSSAELRRMPKGRLCKDQRTCRARRLRLAAAIALAQLWAARSTGRPVARAA